MKRSLVFAAIAFFTITAACAGPAGPPGRTGRTGTTGAQGDTGMTGSQGRSGATVNRSVTTDPSGSTVEEETTVTTP